MFVRCWCMCLAMRPGAKEAAQTRCFLLMPSMRASERRNTVMVVKGMVKSGVGQDQKNFAF